MIDTTNTADLFYYELHPVESVDQAISLTDYLARHGVDAHQEDAEVTVPTTESAAVEIHALIKGWRKFWEHSDKGVFSLPVYSKD